MICTGMEKVKIDINLVPKVEMNTLCRSINKAMEAFYEDPQNIAEFEAWLAERQARRGWC